MGTQTALICGQSIQRLGRITSKPVILRENNVKCGPERLPTGKDEIQAHDIKGCPLCIGSQSTLTAARWPREGGKILPASTTLLLRAGTSELKRVLKTALPGFCGFCGVLSERRFLITASTSRLWPWHTSEGAAFDGKRQENAPSQVPICLVVRCSRVLSVMV